GVEGVAGFGGDGEAGRDREAGVGHLGAAGALAAEEVAHAGAPLVEEIDPLLRGTRRRGGLLHYLSHVLLPLLIEPPTAVGWQRRCRLRSGVCWACNGDRMADRLRLKPGGTPNLCRGDAAIALPEGTAAWCVHGYSVLQVARGHASLVSR